LRNALVVVQVALSLVALLGAGLFVRSLHNAQQIHPGFETEQMMALSFQVGALGYNEAQGQEFYRRVQERTATIPGVQMTAISSNAPFAGGFQRSVTPEGETLPQGSRGILSTTNSIGLHYFEALGTPLLNGRLFTDADRADVTPVAIINEAAAQRFWPGQPALGKRFRFYGDEFYREVIGIMPTTVVATLGEEPQPQIYLPMRQSYADAVALYVRTQADPTTILNTVRREVQSLAPTMPLTNVQTIAEILKLGLWAPRMGAVLLGIFGLLALLLASVGLYGVLAYAVSQRTQEIGIRMALGAPRSKVLRMVLKEGMVLVAAGIGLGVLVGLFATRMLTSLLFTVSAVDPLTFVGMPLLLLLVALLACWIPAWRATKVDPLIALRYE
jgi:predicted permease